MLVEGAVRRLALVLLAACDTGGAPPPPPSPAITLVGCEIAWRPVGDVAAPADLVAPPDLVEPIPPPVEIGFFVEIRPPRVDGGLSPAPVQRALRKLEGAFVSCYERRVAKRPGLAGSLSLDFTVGPDGEVVMPSAKGLDAPLGDCLVGALADLDLPKPRGGGAKVRVTLALERERVSSPDPGPEPDPVPQPAPDPLAALRWADDGVDVGTETWAREQIAAAVGGLDLASCAGDATGTLRARLDVLSGGKLLDVEVAGVGSVAVEDCVKAKLAAAAIPAPPSATAVACTLTVQRPMPVRVTEREGGPTIVRSAGHDDAAALVARASGGGIVAVTDATGALLLVTDPVPRGAGRARATVGPRPRVELAHGVLTASIPGRGVVGAAELGDPAAVRAALAKLTACVECERVVEVAVGAGVEARTLSDVAAQLPRIVLATL